MIKRQQTVETSAFSSNFISLKHYIQDVEQLRLKLQMFEIPISEEQSATVIICGNESVVKNTSNIKSSLNRKHSAIAYHFSRWNMADGVCTIACIPTGEIIADAMTKILAKEV